MEKNAGVCHGKFPVAFVADQIFLSWNFNFDKHRHRYSAALYFDLYWLLSTFDFLRRFRRSLQKFAYLTTKKQHVFARFARFISLHDSYKHFPFLYISQPFSSCREEALASKRRRQCQRYDYKLSF